LRAKERSYTDRTISCEPGSVLRAMAVAVDLGVARDDRRALLRQIRIVHSLASALIKQRDLGKTGHRRAASDHQIVRDATIEVGRTSRLRTKRRVATAIAGRIERVANAARGIDAGTYNGDRASAVVLRREAPVVYEPVPDRDRRQPVRRDAATAALTHLLVVVEDIEERAQIRLRSALLIAHSTVAASVGIDQTNDVVAIWHSVNTKCLGVGVLTNGGTDVIIREQIVTRWVTCSRASVGARRGGSTQRSGICRYRQANSERQDERALCQ